MPEQPNTDEYAAVLLKHAAGRAHDEASAKLREAVEAVKLHGKAAEVTVTLKILPVKNNSTVVQIEDKVTSTIPQEKRTSMWFPDDTGKLHRNDPNQRELWEDKTEATDNKSAAAGRD